MCCRTAWRLKVMTMTMLMPFTPTMTLMMICVSRTHANLSVCIPLYHCCLILVHLPSNETPFLLFALHILFLGLLGTVCQELSGPNTWDSRSFVESQTHCHQNTVNKLLTSTALCWPWPWRVHFWLQYLHADTYVTSNSHFPSSATSSCLASWMFCYLSKYYLLSNMQWVTFCFSTGWWSCIWGAQHHPTVKVQSTDTFISLELLLPAFPAWTQLIRTLFSFTAI